MRILIVLTASALALVLATASTSQGESQSGRITVTAKNLSGSSADLDHDAEAARSFWAFCDSPHGLTVGWVGPNRATYESARKDADDHKRQYKHESAVAND
jgi:hypothetical protein